MKAGIIAIYVTCGALTSIFVGWLATIGLDHALRPLIRPQVPKSQTVDVRTDVKLVQAADYAFAFRLLKAEAKDAGNRNIVVSPYSVDNAMAMMMNGAGGSTRANMEKTLGFEHVSLDQVNRGNSMLRQYIENADPQVVTKIGNNAWISKTTDVPQAFLDVAHKYYGVDIATADLSSSNAVPTINQAISRDTEGHIINLVSPGDVKSSAALLANGVFFDGKWRYPFDKAATKNDSFTPAGSAVRIKTPMMSHAFVHLSYTETAQYQAFCLPYGQGRINLTVVLPNAGFTADGLVKNMNAGKWRLMMRNMEPTEAIVEMPRFTSACKTDLEPVLKSLGMAPAFRPNADFSPMGCKAGYIVAKYGAFLKVDESGTIGAAATAVGPVAGAEPIPVTVDHPFIYAVVDSFTDTILFLGVMNNPAAK